jgi:sugar lactone lactonase YvrE
MNPPIHCNLLRRMVVGLLLILGSAGLPAGTPFHVSGPLKAWLADGQSIGRPSKGLTFSLQLSAPDWKAAGTTFRLDSPMLGGTGLQVVLETMKVEGGRLAATVKLRNSSTRVVEGLRLDLTSAEEEYLAKDEQGKPVTKTRPSAALIASPLLFGDLPAGQVADPVPLEVTRLTSAETRKVLLTFTLSGLAYLGALHADATPNALDVDPQGRLLIGDLVGMRILRVEDEGRAPVQVATVPDQLMGLAVDPKSGDLFATAMNNASKVFRFSGRGEARDEIAKGSGLDAYIDHLRFDPQGALQAVGGGVLWVLRNGKVALRVDKVAGKDFSVRSADRDAQGNLWLLSDEALARTDPHGGSGRLVAGPGEDKLGRLASPRACRVDASGNVFVIEYASDRSEPGRISVFDAKGGFVRVFGHGASAAVPDTVLEGQLWGPTDVAFGPDGRLYVACEPHGKDGRNILIYKPL